MSSRTPARIAVLMGGRSAEREVSLVSGRECAAALRSEGFEVVEIDAGPDLASVLADVRPDVAFNALHGQWGEDGCVQGILEWLRIPYTHSGRARLGARHGQDPGEAGLRRRRAAGGARHDRLPRAHPRRASDGAALRRQAQRRGLVGRGLHRPRGRERAGEARRRPARGAARRGVRRRPRADDGGDGQRGRSPSPTSSPRAGTTITPSTPPAARGTRSRPRSRTRSPRPASTTRSARIGRSAAAGSAAPTSAGTRARGLAGLYLLETNTQPGMTPTSLAPEQAAFRGYSFGALVRWMVEDASCSR